MRQGMSGTKRDFERQVATRLAEIQTLHDELQKARNVPADIKAKALFEIHDALGCMVRARKVLSALNGGKIDG